MTKRYQFVHSYTRHLHHSNFHVGPRALVSILRERIWLVNAQELCSQTWCDDGACPFSQANVLVPGIIWGKWHNQQNYVEEGKLVVVTEDRMPPQQWLLGIVIATHARDYGMVLTLKGATEQCFVSDSQAGAAVSLLKPLRPSTGQVEVEVGWSCSDLLVLYEVHNIFSLV